MHFGAKLLETAVPTSSELLLINAVQADIYLVFEQSIVNATALAFS